MNAFQIDWVSSRVGTSSVRHKYLYFNKDFLALEPEFRVEMELSLWEGYRAQSRYRLP